MLFWLASEEICSFFAANMCQSQVVLVQSLRGLFAQALYVCAGM